MCLCAWRRGARAHRACNTCLRACRVFGRHKDPRPRVVVRSRPHRPPPHQRSHWSLQHLLAVQSHEESQSVGCSCCIDQSSRKARARPSRVPPDTVQFTRVRLKLQAPVSCSCSACRPLLTYLRLLTYLASHCLTCQHLLLPPTSDLAGCLAP